MPPGMEVAAWLMGSDAKSVGKLIDIYCLQVELSADCMTPMVQ